MRLSHGTHIRTTEEGTYGLPKGSIGTVGANKYPNMPGYEVRFADIDIECTLYCFAEEVERV